MVHWALFFLLVLRLGSNENAHGFQRFWSLRARQQLYSVMGAPTSTSPSATSSETSTANIIVPLTSPRFNGSFEPFLGADDLVIVSGADSVGADGIIRTFFQPRQIANATDRELWQWWQERKMTEKVLRSAVGSSKSDISSYFDAFKPFLLADKAEVLQTNDDFFQAILRGDPDQMAALWHASNETVCVIPGTDFVYTGTQAILAHWYTTLAAPRHKLQVRGIKLYFQGDLAVVTCEMGDFIRKPTQAGGAGKGRSAAPTQTAALVTNIFVRPSGTDRYFLTAHIGSLAPLSEKRASLAALQKTYTDPSRAKKRASREGISGSVPFRLTDMLNQLGGRSDNDDDDDDDDDDEEDEDGDEDEEDEDGDGEQAELEEKLGLSNGKFVDAKSEMIRRSIARAIGGSGGAGGARVFVLRGNQLQAEEQFEPKDPRRKGGGSGSSSSSSSSSSSEDDDGDDEQDEDEEQSRLLASRTLQTVSHLASQGRIPQALKKQVTRDVIRSVSAGKFSKAEVAYSLIIGSGRPEDVLADMTPSDFSVDEIPEEDLLEFCSMLFHFEGR